MQQIQPLSNEPCLAELMLIDLNSNELCYYQFMVNFNKFGASCNVLCDPSDRMCAPNKGKEHVCEEIVYGILAYVLVNNDEFLNDFAKRTVNNSIITYAD